MNCNKINDAINEHYRKYNKGFDNDAWVEVVENNVVALCYHSILDTYQKWFHLKRTAKFVLKQFPEVNCVYVSGSVITR